MNVFKEVKINGVTVKMIHDFHAVSPRECDNLSKLIFFGKHSHLGDKHDFNHNDYSGWDELEKAIKKEMKVASIMKVYGYSHGGLTISTSPFSCQWDSGVLGFAVVTKEDIRENYSIKNVTKKYIEKAEGVTQAEVETLDKYIRGEVYGYKVTDKDGNKIDSCWGFLGDDVKTNGMSDYLDKELTEALAEA